MGVDHQQEAIRACAANGDSAIFGVAVIVIKTRQRMRIEEHPHGVVERDAVYGPVRGSLGGVPIKFVAQTVAPFRGLVRSPLNPSRNDHRQGLIALHED